MSYFTSKSVTLDAELTAELTGAYPDGYYLVLTKEEAEELAFQAVLAQIAYFPSDRLAELTGLPVDAFQVIKRSNSLDGVYAAIHAIIYVTCGLQAFKGAVVVGQYRGQYRGELLATSDGLERQHPNRV
jgi:hypothetical protein